MNFGKFDPSEKEIMTEKPFFITTPIYYINSTPHVGHAYTQIAADARARFERLRGREVYFLTGTDENALKVARVAVELGQSPLAFCDDLAAQFIEVWEKLNISYDDFIRTTEPRHRDRVQEVVQQLWDGGFLKLAPYSGWYSVPDETFFRGEDVEARDGGHFIKEPTQDQSKAPLEWVEETGHFFELSRFGAPLLEYYDAHPNMLRPEARRNEVFKFIESGLRDTSISRVQDWGIPIPDGVPEHEGHVVYVWFPDALLNYATAPGYGSKDSAVAARFEKLWPPDLQLMSKDIFTRFHATLWPALLQALDLELPIELFSHGFWTVDGKKIGKRDPETIVEPIAFSQSIATAANADFEIGVDALRYYSLSEVTFGSDGDFSKMGCISRYNSDLANGLGNTLQRAIVMLHKYFDGKVPASSGREFGIKSELPILTEKVAAAYQSLDYSGALATIADVIGRANRLIEEEKPWAKAKDGALNDVADLLGELLAIVQWTAVVIAPVMPHSAAKIWAALGRTAPMKWSDATDLTFEVGHAFAPAVGVFPRADLNKFRELEGIVDEDEKPNKKQKSKQMNTPEIPNTPETTPAEIAAPTVATLPAEENANATNLITFDDFVKIELKVGVIIEAERVPKADKLLRLQVDLGTETRQILAGIAQHYAPDEIVGQTVVAVVNLAPRTLRGYESNGMLLAASNDEGLSLVTLAAPLAPGSRVS